MSYSYKFRLFIDTDLKDKAKVAKSQRFNLISLPVALTFLLAMLARKRFRRYICICKYHHASDVTC